MAQSILPGVKVGPLDPDSTREFGRVGQTNTARQLIRLHAQAHPVELTRNLARKLDAERTKGLDLDEVRKYLGGLELENGDPVVPKGCEVVGAQVRGERDTEQVLTFVYRTKRGRTAKWFAPYGEDGLPDSYASGQEYVKVREMRDRGVVAFDESGTQLEVLRREAAALRRENEALRSHLEGAAAGGAEVDPEEIPEVEGDTRGDNQIVAENEELRRVNTEISERLAALEAALEARVGSPEAAAADEADAEQADAGSEGSVAAQEPPIEGYDAISAHDLAKRLKDDETPVEEKRAILEFERTHQNRRSVISAGEAALGRTG